jgi:hypothetical protein
MRKMFKYQTLKRSLSLVAKISCLHQWRTEIFAHRNISLQATGCRSEARNTHRVADQPSKA